LERSGRMMIDGILLLRFIEIYRSISINIYRVLGPCEIKFAWEVG